MLKTLSKVLLAGLMLSLLLTACATATPAPEPTPVPPTNTPEPTATPLPPTATPEPTATATLEPTATRDPKPSVSNLVFADNAGLTDAKGYGATFDYGVQAVYASVDFANLPEKSKLSWVLTRDDYDVLEVGDYLTVTSGSRVHVLLDQPRQLLPGTYGLLVKAGKLAVSGRFTIDGSKAKPGTTLLTERFDNNDLAWSTGKDEYGTMQVEGGQLRMSATKADSYVASYLPADFRDLDVSVDVQRTAGPRDGYYAVYFRYSYGQGYVFEVGDNGYFNVATQTPKAYLPLIEWTRSTAIKPGEVNSLRVVAKGVNFAFYINDQQVATLKNAEFPKGGLSLVAGVFDQAGLQATFDNVLITVPEDSTLVAVASPTPAATPKPAGTPKPSATKAATTAAGAPSMRQAVARALKSTEALGGALDRLYHGSGAEACGPLMSDYFIVIASPEFDTSSLPGSAQSAYGPYRQAINLIGDKVAPIVQVCLSGGGNVGKLDFDLARQAINEAGSLLTQALNLVGQ